LEKDKRKEVLPKVKMRWLYSQESLDKIE